MQIDKFETTLLAVAPQPRTDPPNIFMTTALINQLHADYISGSS